VGLRAVAFQGALFAWPYQAGVAAYIQERDLLAADSRIYGTSSGAVVAVMLACGIDVARVGTPACLEANERAARGAITGVLPIYFELFGAVLPPDAPARATGRLFVRVTQLSRLRSVLISRFASNAHILDALGASVAIPGLTVRFAHRVEPLGMCVDGGPEPGGDDRPGVATLRVGVGLPLPFIPKHHIVPSQSIGLSQRVRVLPRPERERLFHLGYADARRHLEAA
jgi:hypothetical protein